MSKVKKEILKFSQIIKKNLRELIRNKISLTILLLGPIIIISLLGFLYYNDNGYNLNVGIYKNDQDSTLSEFYIGGLISSGLKVNDNYNSPEECIEDIESGYLHACVFFPDNFEFEEKKTNIIEVKIDNTNTGVEDFLRQALYATVDVQTKLLQKNVTESLLEVVNTTQNSFADWEKEIENLNQNINNIKQNNNDIKEDLSNSDAAFEINDLNTNELLTQKAEEIKTSINTLISSTENLIDDLNSNSQDIESNTNSLNISNSEKSEILDSVELIQGIADDLTIELQTYKNSPEVDELIANIATLKANLENVESSLDEINTQISNKIDADDSELTDVQNSLNAIESQRKAILLDISKINIRDSATIINPVSLDILGISQNAENNLFRIVPSLLASLILIISMFLASNLMLSEKISGAAFRNYMVNTHSIVFLIGNFISLFMIVFVQISILLFIFYFFTSFPFSLTFLSLLFTIIPLIMIFVLIGMTVGYISGNETANSIILFVLIFCFLSFSGTIIPLEVLPESISEVITSNPYMLSESILRKMIVFNFGLFSLGDEFSSIFFIIGIFILINLFLESFNRKRKMYHLYVLIRIKIEAQLKIFNSIFEPKQKPPIEKEKEEKKDFKEISEL